MQRTTIYPALEGQDYIGLPPLEVEKPSLTTKEINAKDEFNRTRLHIAVSHHDVDLVRTLVNKPGIKLDEVDDFGFTPFLLAAASGYNDIIQILLEKNPASASKKNKGNTALHYAVQYQHIETVITLLKKNIGINTKNADDLTALNFAVANQDVASAAFLLAHKANPNGVTKEESEEDAFSVLHAAVETGCVDMVNLLLNTGAKPDRAYGSCYTPFNAALVAKHIFIAEALLARKINEKLSAWKLVSKDSDGNTLLHAAAHNGHLNVVKMLLAHKADTTIKNKAGLTPIDEAIKQNHDAVVALLPSKNITKRTFKPMRHVRFAFDSEKKEVKQPQEKKLAQFPQQKATVFKLEKDEDATIAFFKAVINGNGAFVEWLLKNAKVDITAIDENGNTALHIAADKGYLSILKILLKAKSKLAKELNKNNESPLFVAMNKAKRIYDSAGKNANYVKQVYIAEMLFKQNPDIETQDIKGFTPLRKATQTGLTNIVSLMLPLIANTMLISIDETECSDVVIDDGKQYAVNVSTPLHYAAENGFIDIMKLLIKEGANLEVCDRYDNTPLHTAARAGQLEAVKLLIAKDADLNAVNGNGASVLHIAVKHHQTGIVNFLLEHKVSLDLRDKAGFTAFEYAQKMEYADIVELFKPAEMAIGEPSQQGLFRYREKRLKRTDVIVTTTATKRQE